MSYMRRIIIITIILILLVVFAGCGQRVPTRNTTTWGNTTPTPRRTGGSTIQTPVVPTTTSPFIEVTLAPTQTVTATPIPTYRTPPEYTNITANLTVADEKTLVFAYNSTAYMYTLENPPLLIEYTLTVPNITRIGVEKDPTRSPTADDPNPTREVTMTYPDPAAWFVVMVKDLGTNRIIAQNGYGRQYDVAYSKDVWVRYPGSYYIEFSGSRVTAKIKFWVFKGS